MSKESETPIEPVYPFFSPDAKLSDLLAHEARMKLYFDEQLSVLQVDAGRDFAALVDKLNILAQAIAKIGTVAPSTPPEVFTPTPQPTDGFLYGVNLAGGEFSGDKDGAIYPKKSDIEYFYQRGFNCLRIPLKWFRLQLEPVTPLETWHVNQLKSLVKYANDRGMTVIIDAHDYAERNGVKSTTSFNPDNTPKNALLGSPELPISWFVDFWLRLGEVWKNNPLVQYCLVNEPKCGGQVWRETVDAIVTSLRGAGINNTLQIPGVKWTGAHSWVSSGNAALFDDFVDPANNFVYDVHQYLDSDYSGNKGTCEIGKGSRVLTSIVEWARQKPESRKFFIGEMAAGDPNVSGQSQCNVEFPAFIASIMAARDVCVGYGAWAAGPWSKSYHFRMMPYLAGDNETYMTRTLRAKMPHAVK